MKHPYEEMLQRQQQQEREALKGADPSWWSMFAYAVAIGLVFAAIAGWVE